MRFDRDRLTNIPIQSAARATMTIINAMQDLDSAEQMVALTAAFQLCTERYCIPAQDAFTIANNIMNDADGRRSEFAAVAMYMENELK